MPDHGQQLSLLDLPPELLEQVGDDVGPPPPYNSAISPETLPSSHPLPWPFRAVNRACRDVSEPAWLDYWKQADRLGVLGRHDAWPLAQRVMGQSSVNCPGRNGLNALHEAARQGHRDFVHRFLDNGRFPVDITTAATWDVTPWKGAPSPGGGGHECPAFRRGQLVGSRGG